MAALTIGRMAKLYSLHRSTLYEAVAKGRISAGVNGKGQQVIDLSEMIRVYGEPPGRPQQHPTPASDTQQTLPTESITPLLQELRLLREEVRELREALQLLEHKPSPPSQPTPSASRPKPAAPESKPQTFGDLLADLDRLN